MVEAKISALKQASPREYLIRFAFGGTATILAGLVAKHFGPSLGGLFLAFPALFPATATLIEAHEKKRLGKTGHDGTTRGRIAASIDAAGASLGCVGLAGFALVLWTGLPNHNAALIFMAAAMAWTILSITLWEIRKSRLFGLRFRMMR